MKELRELIDQKDPAWPLVQQWITEATNSVEVLPPPNAAARGRALLNTQVTTRSPMGAIVYETGGLLIDHGWLRILGSGHPRLPRTLPDWNFGRSCSAKNQPPPFCLIADDVVGGFFALDGGGLGLESGRVAYFAPDTLAWENTKKGYTDFLIWCFQGDLAQFYQSMRWSGWERELHSVGGDQVFSFVPWLISETPPLGERSRQLISVAEMYDFHVGNFDSH